MAPDTAELASVREAAQMLDRSLEQVRRYLREGRLAGLKVGQQWFIYRRDLAAWAEGGPPAAFLARLIPLSETDQLAGLVGLGRSGRGDVSGDKHRHLAEAYGQG